MDRSPIRHAKRHARGHARAIVRLLAVALLAAAPPALATDDCCAGRSMRFEPIRIGEARLVKLDASSARADFGGGANVYAAFALPESREPYHVLLSAYLNESPGGGREVFFPLLRTLDAAQRTVRTVPLPGASVRRISRAEADAAAAGSLPFKLEGQLAFGAAALAERYLLVSTSDALRAEVTRISVIEAPGLPATEARVAHRAHGVLRIALVRPRELTASILERIEEREPASREARHAFHGFVARTPDAGGYRHESHGDEGLYTRHLFGKRMESGGIATAWAQSSRLGVENPQALLERYVTLMQRGYGLNHSALETQVTPLRYHGLDCRQMRFSARTAYLDLPTRGYEIYCAYPDEELEGFRVLRVGVSQSFTAADAEIRLAPELERYAERVTPERR